MTIADILDQAADVLEQRGWYQGTWYHGAYSTDPADGCEVCVLAAINAANGDDLAAQFFPGLRQDAALALAKHLGIDLREEDGEYVGQLAEDIANTIGEWNDNPGRTRAQVVTALRTAATKARETGD